MEDEEEHSTITEKMSESINVEGNCIVTEMISDLLINNEEESLVGIKWYEPRYIGDIKSPDLSSPKRAKRCFMLLKNTVVIQKKKLKALQEKNRRLAKKISTLNELIKHLKRKNLISEERSILDILLRVGDIEKKYLKKLFGILF
ncbi:hypothetical protein ABEB36_014145 [Hypothenemus hampei]|uniref:Uncharacterized protein n=1 Tax=Hypothenemus hampei TaxID=57062 RepID=A0ABD1E5K4_HYPHA